MSSHHVVALLLQAVFHTGSTGHVVALSPSIEESVYVQTGEFFMGSKVQDVAHGIVLCERAGGSLCVREAFVDEVPSRVVRLRGYRIGTTEVSNGDYEACVRAGACLPRVGHLPDSRFDAPNLPVVDVTYHEAAAYCQWRGGRLPTEAEWERAARGPLGRTFPWGRFWNPSLCNHGQPAPPAFDDSDGYRYVAPVDAYPASRSPFGTLNMAGNVWEWVADWYSPLAYRQIEPVDPAGPPLGQLRVVRGGGWASPPFSVRSMTRGKALETERSLDVGFRCAWDG